MLTKTHSLPFPFLFSLSKRWHVPNAFCRLERQSRGLMAEAYCIFNWKYLSLLQLKYNIKTIDYEKVFGISCCLSLGVFSNLDAQADNTAICRSQPSHIITVEFTVGDAEDYSPIPNAYIILEGTNHGTSTNLDGYAKLKDIPLGDYVIISCMGYESKRLLMDGQDIFIVLLEKE